MFFGIWLVSLTACKSLLGYLMPKSVFFASNYTVSSNQVLGNIGRGHFQTSGDEIKNEYLRRTRKLLETKLYSRNLMKGINI